MLFLLIQLGRDHYALDTRDIAEVLPIVGIKQFPGAPRGVVGAIRYRGTAVPLVSLAELMTGKSLSATLGTRIVLLKYPSAGPDKLLGLAAPKVTGTLRREPADFAPACIATEAAPYLGQVTMTPQGIVQQINIEALLPHAVREALYPKNDHAIG